METSPKNIPGKGSALAPHPNTAKTEAVDAGTYDAFPKDTAAVLGPGKQADSAFRLTSEQGLISRTIPYACDIDHTR